MRHAGSRAARADAVASTGALPTRPELRAADDAVIEDAIAHADPMVLRGLLYQLTGDPEVRRPGR